VISGQIGGSESARYGPFVTYGHELPGAVDASMAETTTTMSAIRTDQRPDAEHDLLVHIPDGIVVRGGAQQRDPGHAAAARRAR